MRACYNRIEITGNQVLGSRKAAVTKPTGGATVDTECRAAVDALIDRFRVTGGHGSIEDAA